MKNDFSDTCVITLNIPLHLGLFPLINLHWGKLTSIKFPYLILKACFMSHSCNGKIVLYETDQK
jgi:hypothetical protein